MIAFASCQDFLAYLDGLGQFRMRLGLERIKQSLHNLGLQPQPFAVVRVVGTNGKGAVSWLVAQMAAAHGLSVGIFTSPHFVSTRERIMLLERNGVHMPDAGEWLHLANAVHDAGPAASAELVRQEFDDNRQRRLDGLTYFEYLTAMAALHFARQRVDLAVIEAGLGARYDASAAFTPDMVCITPIGLDHENILGPGIEAIATEKSHALRQGAVLAVSAAQRPEIQSILAEAAREGTPLLYVDDAPEPLLDVRKHLHLPGGFQADNARLAMAGWQLLARHQGREVSTDACARGLERTRLTGRLQLVPARDAQPPLVLDGAHNEDGLRVLHKALQERGLLPGACVAGFMADKDLARLLPLLLECLQGPLFLPHLPEVPRAASPEELLPLTQGRGRPALNLRHALELAGAQCLAQGGETPLLVCGSLYLLGEFFKLHPHLVTFS